MTVDARGFSCPMPVVMVQKAVKSGSPAALEVLVGESATAAGASPEWVAHSRTPATPPPGSAAIRASRSASNWRALSWAWVSMMLFIGPHSFWVC